MVVCPLLALPECDMCWIGSALALPMLSQETDFTNPLFKLITVVGFFYPVIGKQT